MNIDSLKSLREVIIQDREKYRNLIGVRSYITNSEYRRIYRVIRLSRIDEFLKSNKKLLIIELLCNHRFNRLSSRLGLSFISESFDAGLTIWHYGCITINPDARIGRNCTLHGNNCIGNLGSGTKSPVIGDNVDIGYGAMILGPVYIADDVKIGAGAVVVHTCAQEGATLIGVPAEMAIK